MNTTSGFPLGRLVGLPRICIRQKHSTSGKPKQPSTGFVGPEGHGEKIWVWSHRRSEQIIYNFKHHLDGRHDLKQLPFNGKKTKPAKLRKDYWSPMAIIDLGKGQGSVGRSVFQKLRELKHLHEVSWGDEIRLKSEKEFTKADKKKIADELEKGNPDFRPWRSIKQRGWALNAQKKNAIADMATVLGGAGPGNKLVISEGNLVPVTINWANDQDREYAEEWSDNVTHDLFDEPSYVSNLTPETPVAAESAEATKEAITDADDQSAGRNPEGTKKETQPIAQ